LPVAVAFRSKQFVVVTGTLDWFVATVPRAVTHRDGGKASFHAGKYVSSRA